ncbi:MAG: hypothetical protein AB4063_07140 [Crocosphaera sp.]
MALLAFVQGMLGASSLAVGGFLTPKETLNAVIVQPLQVFC